MRKKTEIFFQNLVLPITVFLFGETSFYSFASTDLKNISGSFFRLFFKRLNCLWFVFVFGAAGVSAWAQTTTITGVSVNPTSVGAGATVNITFTWNSAGCGFEYYNVGFGSGAIACGNYTWVGSTNGGCSGSSVGYYGQTTDDSGSYTASITVPAGVCGPTTIIVVLQPSCAGGASTLPLSSANGKSASLTVTCGPTNTPTKTDTRTPTHTPTPTDTPGPVFSNPCLVGQFSGWSAVTNVGPAAAGTAGDCGGSVYSVTNATIYPGQTAPGFAPNSNGLLTMVPPGQTTAVQLFSGHGDDATDWARVCETTTVPTNGDTCLFFMLAGIFEDYHFNQGTDRNGDAYFDVRILAGGANCAAEPAANPIIDDIQLNWTFLIGSGLVTLDGLVANNPGTYGAVACAVNGSTAGDPCDWGVMPWTPYEINLCQYAGQEITIEATMYDCNQGGHYGWGYINCPVWSSCAPAPVTLTKSNSPAGHVSEGQTITYTLSYKNTSATQFTDGVVINDTIPTGINLLSNSVTSSPYMPATFMVGNDLGWDVGHLAPDASGSLSFSVTVTNLSGGSCAETIINRASEMDLLTCLLTQNVLVSNPVTNLVGFTCTFTPTITNTPSFTPTVTSTMTYTRTDTITPTNTFTKTFTNTFTNTPTYTSTPTNTPTNTFTLTFTNTLINSATPTNTPTNTFTPTDTNTPINTPTSTNTPTNTFTPTFTNTLVNSATPTNTPTNTFTSTNTNTRVNTFTPTNTSTNTFTSTDTNTPIDTPTPTNTPTNTFTPTYTNTLINTATPTNTPTYTFTLTDTNTPLNTSTPTYTATHTFTSTDTSTLTNTPTHTFTTTPTNTKTATPTATMTNSSTATYTPTFTFTPTLAIGQFSVRVNIYNSAGEVVKTIVVQNVSQPINNITLSTTNQITTLHGPGSTIEILYDGYVIGIWDGSNNLGQPVSNGTYQIQVDSTGPTGVVTGVSQSAIVTRSLATMAVNIYNSAGELIRTLYKSVDDSTGASMNAVVLSTNYLKPGSDPTPVTSGTPSVVSIVVQSSGSPVTVFWDGTNNSATYVTPGVYTIEVHLAEGDATSQTITRQIMVLPGYNAGGFAMARPNVLNSANGMISTFDATGVPNAYFIQVQLYTITGELIQTLTSTYGMPQVSWNAAGMASGIYIAALTIQNSNGGTLSIQRLKILLTH